MILWIFFDLMVPDLNHFLLNFIDRAGQRLEFQV